MIDRRLESLCRATEDGLAACGAVSAPRCAVGRTPRRASPPAKRRGAVSRRRDPARRSGGFTLVELLITISIIGLLAGITLGALQAARQTAREAKTKATIAKLDQEIRKRYESYLTRRVRVPINDIDRSDPAYMMKIAYRRLYALRDLMRMELPERRSDILNGPTAFSWGSIDRPAASHRYLAHYNSNPPDAENPHAAAEYLYMIIAVGRPGAMENFSQSEIGDADGDGWPEFQDGWGQPIMFLRWAPGFTDSNIQATIKPPGDLTAMQQAADTDHDPFDTRQIESHAYKLTPLIYSGGRDKKRGVDIVKDYICNLDSENIYLSGVGTPTGSDHYDNIHNHYQARD